MEYINISYFVFYIIAKSEKISVTTSKRHNIYILFIFLFCFDKLLEIDYIFRKSPRFLLFCLGIKTCRLKKPSSILDKE